MVFNKKNKFKLNMWILRYEYGIRSTAKMYWNLWNIYIFSTVFAIYIINISPCLLISVGCFTQSSSYRSLRMGSICFRGFTYCILGIRKNSKCLLTSANISVLEDIHSIPAKAVSL